MSDLQIGLVSLGIVLILVVVLFNWWQDRRIHRNMQEQFPQAAEDPLMGGMAQPGVRREPGLGAFAPAADEGDAAADDETEVDPACEVVMDIGFHQPVPSDQLYAAVHGVQKVGNKPVRIFAEREGGGHRARLRAGESYASMQLAVLLANRGGPLTDIEWSQLWGIAQGLAERFEGSVEGPEQEPVIKRARQLDELCAGLDAQVALALRLGGTRPVHEVARVAKEAGFLAYGRQLAWMAESGIPRFTLQFDGVNVGEVQSAGVDRVDLLLDLPNSPADEQAFSRMASVGRDLAARLHADLVDDQGKPVPEGADHTVDQRLYELYGKLDQAGFPAGTERTLRVFS
jgi:hypothetical protein